MGRIQSNIGLITGVNITDTVDKLMAINGKPRDSLVKRNEALQKTQVAITELTALVIGVQLATDQLGRPATLSNRIVSSSKSDIITASSSGTPAVGKSRLTSIRLSQTQQLTSSTLPAADQAIGSGEIIVRSGGFLDNSTALDQLNGGNGIERGLLRITDRSGATADIDLRFAMDMKDVLQTINSSDKIRVNASLDGDKIVLKDLTGLSTSNLKVEEVGTGTTASSLGLLGIDAASASAQGSDIQKLTSSTKLNRLLDGRGLQFQDGNDFRVTLKDGSQVDVNLTLNPSTATVGDLVSALNTAGTGKFTVAIAADGDRLQITDTTGGGGSLTIADLSSGNIAEKLGLEGTTAGTSLSGDRLLSGLESPLLSSLRGGVGVGALGVLSITDRSGASANIDLSTAETVGDVLKKINDAAVGVTAVLNSSRNGIVLRDTTGQSVSNFIIANGDATDTAEKLGIELNSSNTTVNSGSLDLQWVTNNTLLTSLNQGRGVRLGSFSITDSTGQRSAVNLASLNAKTVGDVISAVNDLSIGVEARINSQGDGIEIVDTANGTGSMSISDTGSGNTAADLRIRGTSVSKTINSQTFKVIDGSQTIRIAVSSTDKIADVLTKINQDSSPLSANTLSLGAAGSRLVINSRSTGIQSRFQVESSVSGLSFSETSAAQDALISVGATSTTSGVLINSSTNNFNDTISGINLTIKEVSDTPIEISVTDDSSGIEKSLDLLVTQYNKVTERIKAVASYDSTTKATGLLFGSVEVLRIQQTFGELFSGRGSIPGRFKSPAELGISLDDQGKLQVDKTRFRARMNEEPDAVKEFFGKENTGFSARAKKAIDRLSGTGNSLLLTKSQTLQTQVEQNSVRIESLNARLNKQRERLLNQFYKMEESISKIQKNSSTVANLSNLLQNNNS
jgi:flagellar hook-associated protein 2